MGEDPLSRRDLLDHLKTVIDLSFDKMMMRNTPNASKASWARVVNNAYQVAASILKDSDYDKLRAEVEEIKLALNLR